MIVKTLNLKDNKDHWSTDWIPISYINILDKKNIDKSFTFLWSEDDTVNAITRCYYISKNQVEIGDVWLNEKYRGKKDKDGKKYSYVFMDKVIKKIWKLFPIVKKISLIVSSTNKPAINLYYKLNFTVKEKNISKAKLGIKNGFLMIRKKKK